MIQAIRIILAVVVLALAVGCAVPENPRIAATPPPSQAPNGTPPVFSLDDHPSLAPDDVLLQQDYRPGLLRPEVQYPFGRVAPFTLFANGTLIYLDEGRAFDQQQLMQATLPPSEAEALVQRVLDRGLARLESHTDECAPTGETTPEGEAIVECVMDAGTIILRARMPTGSLREVIIYGDFANDPQALKSIKSLLEGYTHAEAQPYIPEQATLFFYPVEAPEGPTAGAWPLDHGLLAGVQDGQWQVIALEGEALAAFLRAIPRNMGDFSFEHTGRGVQAFLVPWLPGADHRAAITTEFPPREGRAEKRRPPAPGRLSGCPQPPEIPDDARFQVAYVSSGDIWILDEGQESRQLTRVGDAETLKLSPDGGQVVFTRRTPGKAPSLWAASPDSGSLQPLAPEAGLTGDLEILAFSDAFPLVAFTQRAGPYQAELWVADLTGAGARRLVSPEQLYALLDEPGTPPTGAIPASIAWVPGTPTLVYDAHPTYDREGIYIYIQRQVAVVDALTGEQRMLLPKGQGGMLLFSPDGRRAAVSSPQGLRLLDLVTGDLVPAGVDYFATGMGEYYVYPPLAWAPDAQSLVLVQPRQEGYEYDEPVTAFRVPADGSPATPLGEFSGFIPSFNLSPDGSLIAYWHAEPQSEFRSLYIARLDGSESLLAASGDLLEFLNWTPDSRRFTYRFFEEGVTYVGEHCQEPVAMAEEPLFIYPIWLDPLHFLFTQETDDGVALRLGSPGGLGGLPLAVGKAPPQFDLVAFPAP